MDSKKIDQIVESNVELLRSRSAIGIEKYGTTLSDSNLPMRDRLNHALLEALDQANYLQWAIHACDQSVAVPVDCSGTPASCPDNEGYGCACSPAAAPQVVADEQWIDKLTYDAQVDEWAIEKSNLEREIEALKSCAPVQAQEPVAYIWSVNGMVKTGGDSVFDDHERFYSHPAPVRPVAVPDGWREKLIGLSVSMDVSTGEENGGDRIFGEVEEVMDDGDALVLLAVESSRNFAAPAAQGDAKWKERFDFLSNYRGPTEFVRETGGKVALYDFNAPGDTMWLSGENAYFDTPAQAIDAAIAAKAAS